MHIYERFLTFGVLVQAQAALRDRRNFFSTNDLGLVNKFLEIINEALMQKCANQEIVHFVSDFLCLFQLCAYIRTFIDFRYFIPSKRFSAGSQIFFLDKQSETCQKIL